MRRRGLVLICPLSRNGTGSLLGRDDLHSNAAVAERLLADGVALLTCFELGLFAGVGLQEAIELFLLAPVPAIVVVAYFAGSRVDDGGIAPTRQLHEQSGGLCAE